MNSLNQSNKMTPDTLHNVLLTENEISVILYYLEEVANRSKEEYDPEIDTIFDKLQSVGYTYS